MSDARRIPAKVHTRKIDRAVAKQNMQKSGMKNINKLFRHRDWREWANRGEEK